MASTASDFLAVMLLQKEAGVASPLRVVPLFETSRDLEQAGHVLEHLLSLDWYRDRIQGRQEVMIGYSDSAKDAGRSAGDPLPRALRDDARQVHAATPEAELSETAPPSSATPATTST